jgi:hypothetical protein
VGLFDFFKKKPAAPSGPRLPTVHELCAGLPKTEPGLALYHHIMAAEKAYEAMYERGGSGAYSDMKESMSDAIRLATELGLAEKASQLQRVLDHRKSVFRSQLS